MNQNKTTILLADDHRIVREGLRAIIESQPDLQIIGEAETGSEAVLLAKELKPDVVLMDVAMPKLNGVDAARIIHREVPSSRVLFLSCCGSEDAVKESIAVGAAGYLVKENAGKELFDALRQVRRGHTYFSAALPKRILQQTGATSQNEEQVRPLTVREREILKLIAEGFMNKTVGDILGISIKTVEKHRQAVMNKLGIHETAGLTRYALENGIIASGLAARP